MFAPKKKRNQFFYLQKTFQCILSLLLLAGTILVLSVMMKKQEIPQNTGQNQTQNTVEVVPVKSHSSGIDFQVSGEVIPYRSIQIAPEVQGRIIQKSKNCRIGRFVQENELLAKIDPTDYEFEVRRYEQSVEQASSSILETSVQIENVQSERDLAQEQFELKKKDLARYESVSVPGTYSEAEIDDTRLALLSTKESLQKLENQIRLLERQKIRLESTLQEAKINLEYAELNLKRTEIKAPISGVITEDGFELDSYVQKGTGILTLQDTTRLDIQCSLHMKQLQWLWEQNNLLKPKNLPKQNGDFIGFENSESFLGQNGKMPSDSFFGSENSSNPNLSDDAKAALTRQTIPPPLSDKTKSAHTGYVLAPTDATILYELDGIRWAWRGRLTTYDGAGLNAVTRMMPCRITIDNPHDVRQIHSETPLSQLTFSDVSSSISSNSSSTAVSNNKSGNAEPPAILSEQLNTNSIINQNTIQSTEQISGQNIELNTKLDSETEDADYLLSPPSLLSGMHVTIILHAKPGIPFFLIPEKAILPGNNIWTASGGILQKHQIRVATTGDLGVLFYAQGSGLTTGDQVVVSPMVAPVNGERVSLMSEPTVSKLD